MKGQKENIGISRGYDDYYDIEFEDTGYKRKAKLQDVYNGNIFDRLKNQCVELHVLVMHPHLIIL